MSLAAQWAIVVTEVGNGIRRTAGQSRNFGEWKERLNGIEETQLLVQTGH